MSGWLGAARRVAWTIALVLAMPGAGEAQQAVDGWFHIVWGIQPDRPGVNIQYMLTDLQGRTHRLQIDERLTAPHGGPLSLDRRQVTVRGVRPAGYGPGAMELPLVVSSIVLREPTVQAYRAQEGGAHATMHAAPPQSGSKPYVTVLCRFADSVAVMPKTKAYYDGLLLGTARPGLDHYWREVSDNRINLIGSAVVGWYDLPDPKAAYFETKTDGTPDLGKLKFGKLATDCLGKADPDVDFRTFFGVNIQVNGRMTYSWGGSGYVTQDGVNRVTPMTWMASWAGHQVYAHEMGHSFGLPHSSGPYGQVYDSRWDVMSGGGRWEGTGATAEYVGVHTISYHKDLLAWVPGAQKYTATAGTDRTITLQRLASPTSSTEYLMAQLPLATGEFYTVEARRFTGYDGNIPGEAVVIHRVRTNTAEPAKVVDPDNNNNPNDAGAMWTVGETYLDNTNDLAISVVGQTPTGFQVRIVRGSAPVVITTDSIRGVGVVGQAYADTVRATGGLGAFTWSVTSGSLPGGVRMDASTGAISGAPTAKGSFSATLQATSGGKSASKTYSINVYEPLVIASDSVRRSGLAGAVYGDTLSATGGTGAYTWSVTEGALPAGMAFDAARAVLSGTPTQAGTFRFTVRVASSVLTTTKRFSLAVLTPVAISSDSLRTAATMGAVYSDSLAATGGDGVLSWTVTEGKLPAGLSLNAGTGRISGTVEEAGTFRFTARAASAGLSATRGFVIVAARPQLQPTAILDQLLGTGSMTQDQIRYLDLIGNRNGRLDVGDVRAWLLESRQISATEVVKLRQIVDAMEGTPPADAPRTPNQER